MSGVDRMGNIEHGSEPEPTNAEAVEDAIRTVTHNGTVGAQHAARLKLRKMAADADAYRGAVEEIERAHARLDRVGGIPRNGTDGNPASLALRIAALARYADGGQ